MGSFGHYPYPLDSDGAPIDTPEWRDGNNIKKLANPSDTDLIKAVRFDDRDEKAVDNALAAGADINQTDKFGFTPLMLALKAQNQKLIYKFLDIEGVDVNCKSTRGFTPLMIAAWKGDTGSAAKLIKAGANLKAVERRSEDGRKDGEGLMEVNLDRLSGDQCAALLERARELAALASES